MRKFLPCLLPLFLIVAPVQAGGPDTSAPALFIQVRSLERVTEHAKTILSLIGKEEIAGKIDTMLRAKIGPGGLEGVDPRKPLGVVVRFGKDIGDIEPLFLVPISDEKAFLKMLEANKVRFEKGKNDLYTVRIGKDIAIELYFRFTQGYLAGTVLNQDAIADGKLNEPLKLLGKEGPTLSATLRIDKVPMAARQLAIGEFEKFLAPMLKAPEDGDAKVIHDLNVANVESIGRFVKSVLTDGEELRFTLDFEPKSRKVLAHLSLTARSGTELAKSLQALEKQESRFGSLLDDRAAFNAVLNFALPEKTQRAFLALFQDLKKQALEDLRDKGKRLEAEALFAIMEPTFSQGNLDAFFDLSVNKDNTLNYLVGLSIKDGKKLEAQLRELVKQALSVMPKEHAERIKLDFAREGGFTIHRFEIPKSKDFEPVAALLGDSHVYFVFRNDAVFVALGKEGQDRIKHAATNAKAAKAPILLYRADLNRMAGMFGKAGTGDAEKLFPPGADSTVLMRIDGGRSLTVRIELPLNLFLMSKTVEKK